jgi:hypothetical protein
MIKVLINDKKFMKEMNNIVKYTEGFFEGAQRGRDTLHSMLAPKIAELAAQYIDANARVNPDSLHHIYEWYRVGSPSARLFDINYTVTKAGMSFGSEFRQSTTIKDGSNTPFYNKAAIMENGMPVLIKPKRAQTLRFEVDGEEVFTKNPVVVDRPGGNTQGQFEKTIREFFALYFRQSFLTDSGLLKHFKMPVQYKTNIRAGKNRGRSAGIDTGFKWVVSAGAKL